jgi:LacI family transcriptional regulator
MSMARNIKQNSQRNVLILMEWYDHAIRKGIAHFAREHDWHLSVPVGAMLPSGWRGDGVLTVVNRRDDLAEFLGSLNCPIVDFGCYRPDLPFHRVTGDHEQIGRLGAEHFLSREFRHLAFFALSVSPVEALRLKGFKDACGKEGAPRPFVWELPQMTDWAAANRWLARRLRRAAKPLGVLAFNDEAASWIEDSCRAANLQVPEEVAILGVDDNDLICLNQPVPLSSIAHDREKVGYEGAATLARLMDGEDIPLVPKFIPPDGVVPRQSSDATAVEEPRVKQAFKRIRERLAEPFGAEELAADIGISRPTLDRLFCRYLGRTAHEEIDRVRFDTAKELMRRTGLPLSEIASRVGFCNAQYLSHLVRQRMGLTSRVFRKRST